MGKTKKLEPWIGIVEVKPRPRNNDLGKAKGAFVVALALAKNVKSYDSAVCRHLKGLGFIVLKISDIEPLSDKISHASVDKKILGKVKSLSKQRPVYLHTFHTFPKK